MTHRWRAQSLTVTNAIHSRRRHILKTSKGLCLFGFGIHAEQTSIEEKFNEKEEFKPLKLTKPNKKSRETSENQREYQVYL